MISYSHISLSPGPQKFVDIYIMFVPSGNGHVAISIQVPFSKSRNLKSAFARSWMMSLRKLSDKLDELGIELLGDSVDLGSDGREGFRKLDEVGAELGTEFLHGSKELSVEQTEKRLESLNSLDELLDTSDDLFLEEARNGFSISFELLQGGLSEVLDIGDGLLQVGSHTVDVDSDVEKSGGTKADGDRDIKQVLVKNVEAELDGGVNVAAHGRDDSGRGADHQKEDVLDADHFGGCGLGVRRW